MAKFSPHAATEIQVSKRTAAWVRIKAQEAGLTINEYIAKVSAIPSEFMPVLGTGTRSDIDWRMSPDPEEDKARKRIMRTTIITTLRNTMGYIMFRDLVKKVEEQLGDRKPEGWDAPAGRLVNRLGAIVQREIQVMKYLELVKQGTHSRNPWLPTGRFADPSYSIESLVDFMEKRDENADPNNIAVPNKTPDGRN
jgi:hypothetical protein